jgi:hypothetical protein
MADPAKMKICYAIEKSNKPGGKDFWHRIGVAFVNSDGSLNVRLVAFPVGGEMQIRDYVPREGGRPASPTGSPSGSPPTGSSETPPTEDNIPF